MSNINVGDYLKCIKDNWYVDVGEYYRIDAINIEGELISYTVFNDVTNVRVELHSSFFEKEVEKLKGIKVGDIVRDKDNCVENAYRISSYKVIGFGRNHFDEKILKCSLISDGNTIILSIHPNNVTLVNETKEEVTVPNVKFYEESKVKKVIMNGVSGYIIEE